MASWTGRSWLSGRSWMASRMAGMLDGGQELVIGQELDGGHDGGHDGGNSRMAGIGQELDIGQDMDYCDVLIYLCIRASRDGITLLTTVYKSKKLNLPLPS